MKIQFADYSFDITLPDRPTVQKLRHAYRLLSASNPGVECTPEQAAEYGDKRDELAYQAIESCKFAHPDEMVVLSVGHELLTYIIQGPARSRIPTMDDLSLMIGKLAMCEGSVSENRARGAVRDHGVRSGVSGRDGQSPERAGGPRV